MSEDVGTVVCQCGRKVMQTRVCIGCGKVCCYRCVPVSHQHCRRVGVQLPQVVTDEMAANKARALRERKPR